MSLQDPPLTRQEATITQKCEKIASKAEIDYDFSPRSQWVLFLGPHMPRMKKIYNRIDWIQLQHSRYGDRRRQSEAKIASRVISQ